MRGKKERASLSVRGSIERLDSPRYIKTDAKKRAALLTLLIAFGVLIADRISKQLVVRVGWPFVMNTGIAFGLFSEVSWLTPILVLAVLVLGIYRVVKSGKGLRYFDGVVFGLILGGGASNGLDRLRNGGIVDFIFIGLGPRFNFADIAIVLGTVLAIWNLMDLRRKRLKFLAEGSNEA